MLKKGWKGFISFIKYINDQFESKDPYSQEEVNNYIKRAKKKYM